MKLKILVGMITIIFCLGLAMAETTMHSTVSCVGNCSVVQTFNNETFEISTNESLNINSDLVNNTLNVSVNATGSGELKTSGESDYEIISSVDDESEKTEKGTGIFQFVYNFFKNINFFGLFRVIK